MPVNAPDDVAAIRRIEELLQPTVAIREVIASYADEALVLDHSTPGLYRGRREIFDAFSEHLDAVSAMSVRFDDCTILSDGELAAALMQLSFDAVMKDGTRLKASTRNLDAFAKVDGRWQIIQQHIALPLSREGHGLRNAIVPAGEPLFYPWAPQFGSGVSAEQAESELVSWTRQNIGATTPAEQTELHAPESLLYDAIFPGILHGHQAIGARIAASNARQRSVEVDAPQVERRTNGRFAVQVSIRLSRPDIDTVEAGPAMLRQSNCLVRIGGRWQSILEMRSFLVDRLDRSPASPPADALYPGRTA